MVIFYQRADSATGFQHEPLFRKIFGDTHDLFPCPPDCGHSHPAIILTRRRLHPVEIDDGQNTGAFVTHRSPDYLGRFRRGQFLRQVHRPTETRRARDSFAGDIETRAVIRTRAHVR